MLVPTILLTVLTIFLLLLAQCSLYFIMRERGYNNAPLWAFGLRRNPFYIVSSSFGVGKAYKIIDELNFIRCEGFGGATTPATCFKIITIDRCIKVIDEGYVENVQSNINSLKRYFKGDGYGGYIHKIFQTKAVPGIATNSLSEEAKNTNDGIIMTNHLFINSNKINFEKLLSKIDDYGVSDYCEYVNGAFHRLNPMHNSAFITHMSAYQWTYKINKQIYTLIAELCLSSTDFKDFKRTVEEYIYAFENCHIIDKVNLVVFEDVALKAQLEYATKICQAYKDYLKSNDYIPIEWFVELQEDIYYLGENGERITLSVGVNGG